MMLRGLYCMDAFNGQLPDWVDGGTLSFPWTTLNPAPGVYAWGSLDKQIEMLNGKPVALLVTVARSGLHGKATYWDDTPAWVYGNGGQMVDGRRVGHAVPCAGRALCLPAYDHDSWRDALRTFTQAFMAHSARNARVTAVTISAGLDGETHGWKDGEQAAAVNAAMPSMARAFEQYVELSCYWYRAPTVCMPLYCANNPGGQAFRKRLTQRMVGMGIGVKNCGLNVDWPTAWGPAALDTDGGNYCVWGPVRDTRDHLPTWAESQTGVCTRESVYWSLAFAVSMSVPAVDLHKSWLAWPGVCKLYQRDLTDPDWRAWIMFRDAEYPALVPGTSPASKYYLSGWPGDFAHGMRQEAGAGVRVWRKDLPVSCRDQAASRQARKLTDAAFAAERGERFIALRFCYLDVGVPFAFTVAGKKLIARPTGTGRFVWQRWGIKPPVGTLAITMDGQCIAHAIQLVRGGQ